MIKQFRSTKIIKIIGIVIGVIIILGGWAWLTVLGHIPNFLHIQLLEPKPAYPICEGGVPCKPVIYFYPDKIQDTKVILDYEGQIGVSYPQYNSELKGWEVVAYPDGHLINKADGKEYSYLFWEGKTSTPTNWDLTKGFVIKGEDTAVFLQEILSQMGLTPREYNEFIVYWYSQMKDNAYNLIHFANEEYSNLAKLTITPKPDSILRVFMVYKPTKRKISIEPQIITPFERKGFTVIEWGGTAIK